MIEVEEKFELKDKALEQIKRACQFLREEKLHNKYFDYSDNRLFLADIWLRDRNGRLELKYPVHKDGHFNYKEYDIPEEIFEKLDIKYAKDDNWQETLQKNDLKVVIDYKDVRQKYKCGDFNIDVDVTNFGHSLFEVEVMVEDESQIKEAEDRIFYFLKRHNIETKPTYNGKNVVYLKRFLPDVYQKLKDKGIVR